MGNIRSSSNVSDAVKKQAAGLTEIYKFIDLKGGGQLVDLIKKAVKNKKYDELDEKIREGFKPFLYNDGKGEKIHFSDLMQARSSEKTNIDHKKSVDLFNLDAVCDDGSDRGSQYKEVCWRVGLDEKGNDQRGSVGETPLHVCLLNATSLHADLAKRLLQIYPNLIKDIYISDEYYGENVLHMAIVNEDPAMVKFLLDKGADYHQRCCGMFFTADDQKASRQNNKNHEWPNLAKQTNYEGYAYWGEYPIGFAACLGQEECVRLLLAKGADPNKVDSNGNSALHMIVINFDKMKARKLTSKQYSGPQEMFDLLYNSGAKLDIKNNQGLTPLTLAAKLARKKMFDHIMKIDREVYWIYGNVSCAGYPLEHIDTISETGEINTNSVLYHVVHGDEPDHLLMFDGTVEHLLDEKWKTFARDRFFRRFAAFILYFLCFLVAVSLRPAYALEKSENSTNETLEMNECYLLSTDTVADSVRLAFEALTLVGAVTYIVLALREIYFQGYCIFFQTLMTSPAKMLFLASNFIIVAMVPGRGLCAYIYEDILFIFAILTICPYFLFFCRGFKIVGPFVVMIYRMIRTDLLRFFTIYLIFVVGFSQSMFVLFRGYNNPYYYSWIESMIGMFCMSLGAFFDIYETFDDNITNPVYLWFPKIIFVIYMILVTLLLVNMLIAMMGHTYESVNESQREWHRQWAKIILVIEQTVTTKSRCIQELKYSQPMKDGRRALSIRWHQSDREKEDLAKARELQRKLTAN